AWGRGGGAVLLLTAARAQAVDLEGLGLGHEAERAGALVQRGDDLPVLQFDRRMATVADQERHRMLRGTRMVAGDEGVDRFELVDEAVGEQEVERAIDRRRRCSTGTLGIG